MEYWGKADWQSIKKDIQKGWKEGVAAVKEGSIVAKKKAGELSDEGKRRYKIFELKTKIHKKVYDLGERVHVILNNKKRSANPALDSTVKTIMGDISKLEAQIGKLSGAPKKASRKRKRA